MEGSTKKVGLQSTAPGPASGANPYDEAMRGLRQAVAASAGLSAVINVLMLTGSIYMLQVYDRVLASGSVPTLLGLFAIVVVLHGFLGFYDFLRARLMGRAAVRLDRVLGPQAFAWWTDPARGGQAGGSSPLRDLDSLRGALTGPAASAVFDAPWVPLYLGALFLVHPTLGWLTLAGAAVAACLAALNHGLTRGPISRLLAREEDERGLADRARRGAEVVRAMGMQAALAARWQSLRDAALAAGQSSGDPAEALAAASRAFRLLLQSAILTAGAWLVILGEISGGMIIAASILSGRALGPVDQVIGNWRAIRRGKIAHDSLHRLFAAAPAEAPRPRLPGPAGRVEVAGVSRFARRDGRPDDGRPILDGVSFGLEPGDGLGVIGASGSGKSTLARLIVGALDPDRGEVRLDGATLDQWEPARLGRYLGYLPQGPDPLAGSVRDLVARFDPEVSDSEVIAAARLAGVHEMILALPDGYATVIGGEGGTTLSGGQAQRLGLARAVCGMPRLVVLDEPNAHLDAAGEAALACAVAALREAGSVVVVVAHRPSALAVVNKLLVLEAGRVARFGDKEELLAPAPPATRRIGPAAATAIAPPPSAPVVPLPRAVAARMQRLSDLREARDARAARSEAQAEAEADVVEATARRTAT